MDLRCFIAIKIQKTVKESIENIKQNLMKSGADVKWVSFENLHITLKFLGKTDELLVPSIIDSLYKKLSPYTPFYIKITGIGCFPGLKRPRVLWIGSETPEILRKIQSDVENEMAKFGYTEEKRTYTAHITIGRVRSQKINRDLIKKMDGLREQDFGAMEINKICLMKSELKPAGAQYHTLAEIPIGWRSDVQ